MAQPAHKHHTRTFGELTFAEQAKSISASINNLQNSMSHHIKISPKPDETRKKCLQQLHRCLGRLLHATLIIFCLVIVGGCGDESTRPEVEAFRQSLFKTRADLQVGISKSGYADDLRALKLRYDEATRVVSAQAQSKEPVKSYIEAYNHYMQAYEIQQISDSKDRNLSLMSPSELDDWPHKAMRLRQEIGNHISKAGEILDQIESKR